MINEIDCSVEEIFDKIVFLASFKTGNVFRDTHKAGIIRYVEKRTKELKTSYQEYISLIQNDEKELLQLINASTVNETYFFREEKQFDLLANLIAKKNKVNIWSAASSSGEEIYSIKLLCDLLNVQASLFASDINTDKLKILKEGKYNAKQVVRDFDGRKFHNLLETYVKDEMIDFSPEVKNSIESARINLVDFDSYEILGQRKFDVIFLRNVFIYFPLEVRYRILDFIAEKYLLEDGYIFVSLSEIAQLDGKKLSQNMEKICMDDVFVFHKKKSQGSEVKYE